MENFIFCAMWIVIYQDDFEYLAAINVLVSNIIKISREFNLTNENQIHNIRENIFQGNECFKAFV